VSGGKASLSTSALSAGAHSITATYNGDTNYAPGTSPELTQTINSLIATSTSLTSSPNPSTHNQTVKFTATVTASAGTHTGTMKLLDGSTTLGSSTLNSSGVAVLSVSNLSTGSHSITAQYGGSSTDNGSTSPVLTQVVQPRRQ
jgi:hypothetical protein